MQTPAECRQRALECMSLAEKEGDSARELLLEIAESWLRMAKLAEEQERLLTVEPEAREKAKLS